MEIKMDNRWQANTEYQPDIVEKKELAPNALKLRKEKKVMKLTNSIRPRILTTSYGVVVTNLKRENCKIFSVINDTPIDPHQMPSCGQR